MSALSDYLENAVLNWMRGTTFPTAPTTLYLALFTASPTDAGLTANELTSVNSPGYTRVAMAPTDWSVPADLSGAQEIHNVVGISFPEATANWAGPITHVGIFTASSGGNMLFHGALGASRTVTTGDVLRFSVGALQLSMA